MALARQVPQTPNSLPKPNDDRTCSMTPSGPFSRAVPRDARPTAQIPRSRRQDPNAG